jgi:hypothetical protein
VKRRKALRGEGQQPEGGSDRDNGMMVAIMMVMMIIK